MIRSCAKAKFGSVPATPQKYPFLLPGEGGRRCACREKTREDVGRVALPVISCCLVDVLDVVAGHHWAQWPQRAKKLRTSLLMRKEFR